MNIIISSAALRSSGGLIIYKQFINHLFLEVKNDRYYVFVDESMPKPNINGVKYIVVDLKSFIKRIKFDYIGCAHILNKMGVRADVIVSLQNTCVNYGSKCRNILYYHQSLPFYNQKWNLFKKDERILFLYKHIYPCFVKSLLKKKDQIVVQIPFIKKGFVKKFKMPEDNVHVLFPDTEKISVDDVEIYNWNDNRLHFMYPATAFSYKNHITLINAIYRIKTSNPTLLRLFKLHFTIAPEDKPDLYKHIKEYHIEDSIDFMGNVSHEKLLSMYKSCIALVFPSTIETLGLPLIEAASFGLPIIASDLDYAKEVLNGYEGATFICPKDDMAWGEAMTNLILHPIKFHPLSQITRSSWSDFFKLIRGNRI